MFIVQLLLKLLLCWLLQCFVRNQHLKPVHFPHLKHGTYYIKSFHILGKNFKYRRPNLLPEAWYIKDSIGVNGQVASNEFDNESPTEDNEIECPFISRLIKISLCVQLIGNTSQCNVIIWRLSPLQSIIHSWKKIAPKIAALSNPCELLSFCWWWCLFSTTQRPMIVINRMNEWLLSDWHSL